MAEVKESVNAVFESVVLMTNTKNKVPLERKNIEITITENITYPFIECKIVYKDTEGDFEDYNFSGGEIIVVDISFPKLGDSHNIKETFFVYEITPIEYNDKEVTYSFHGLSIEYTKTCNNLISEAFSGNITNIVKKIINEKIYEKTKVKRSVFVSEKIKSPKERNGEKIIIANMDPYKALNFLATRAVGTKDDVFVFFKNTKGYKFVGFNELFEQKVSQQQQFKIGFTNSAGKDSDERKNSNAESDRDEQTIEGADIRFTNNYLEGLNSHIFAGETITHDLLTQETNKHKFSLKDDFSKIPKLGKKNIHSLYDYVAKTFTEGSGTTKLVSKSKFGYEKNIHLRNYLIYSIKNCLDINFGSDTATGVIRAGTAIEIEVPTTDLTKNQDNKENPDPNEKLTGKYLIKSVEHLFTGEKDNLKYTIAVNAFKNATG